MNPSILISILCAYVVYGSSEVHHSTATVYPSLIVMVPPTSKSGDSAAAGASNGWSIFDPVKNWLYGNPNNVTTVISQ